MAESTPPPTESLLAPSQIKLFGRLFAGLTLNPPSKVEVDPNARAATGKKPPPAVPDPGFDQLTNQLLRNNAKLARIYSFTYEGVYYTLPRPTVYLVHGDGRKIDAGMSGELDKSGVAARDWAFENDILYWEYDRVNYSLRCDIVTGSLDDILLDACFNCGSNGASRTDMSARGTDMVSRGTDMVSRGTDMVARSDLTARHRAR